MLVRDYNTEASREALKLCCRVVLDLGVGFDFPISMSVLTLSEHTSRATAQFCFDCHETRLLSWRQGLVLEKQPVKESTAQSGIGRDCVRRTMKKHNLKKKKIIVLALISFSYNRH